MSTSEHTLLREVLQRHPGLRLAILFGSLATGRARPESDIDLAVDAGRPLDAHETLELIADLAEATGRPVDLIDLARVGEPMLGQILKHGERLLGRDEDHARLLSRYLIDSADFMPHYRRILAQRRQAWIRS